MKTLFEQTGYSVSETRQSSNNVELKVLYINNSDGSLRWMWPSRVKTPLFLKFYNASDFRSKLIALLFRLVFRLRIQELLFRTKKIYVSKIANSEVDFDMQSNWALFTGTIGPNNKAILYTQQNGMGSFIKIACTQRSRELLEREANTLNRLGSMDLQNFVVPELYSSSLGLLRQFELLKGGKRSGELTPIHLNALIELNEFTSFQMPLVENRSWENLKRDLKEMSNSRDNRLPKGMIRKLERLVQETNEYNNIEVSLCHGDFTPWNMYRQSDLLYIYDWELADPMRPLGFDLFHFIIQQGILVERKSWKQISADIDRQVNSVSFNLLSKFKNVSVQEYLKMYLLYNTVYYLKLYAAQPVWHLQVYWLFNTWNEALSQVLSESVSARELVLIDTFDFLMDKNYAAIKFSGGYPEKLSQFSDVDLCIEKSAEKELFRYLRSHPLVRRIYRTKKTFMSTQQLFFSRGEMLSLDLIWEFKRKGLQLMDKQMFMENATLNDFGMKMPEVSANARYVGLFYASNKAPIPAKYTYYEELLSHSGHALDRHLYPCYVDGNVNKKYLLKFIKSQPENRGWRGFCNQFNYVLDGVLSHLHRPGTVITFSGVDGAGKSTVIESLKYRLEKQLRRRVVVLRHRPSVLPILSAWSKGKQKAEADSMRSLPRTGKNSSFISSLFRFAYYYTDYVIGQFLVYARYVSRGYIVIYDRYYFDFIHDSKRSNIVLPAPLLKGGLRLLIKPRFNFFLYADAQTILARKKELDEATISSLTASYLGQFNQMRRGSAVTYTSIRNTDLKQTLDVVFNTISAKAA